MDTNTLSLTKDGKTYVFRYASGNEGRIVDEIMELADDRRCPIDWLDAATLGFQIAQYAADACVCELEPPSAGATEGPCSTCK